MASIQHLLNQTSTFINELNEKQILLDSLTKFRIICAICIQKAWRGYEARHKFVIIRKAIITVQSYCRGWMVRRRKTHYVQQHDVDMQKRYKHIMAIRIQAAWRGYAARKVLKNQLPKERIQERKRVLALSNQMKNYMHYMFEKNRHSHKQEQSDENKNMVMYILFKCHHLLRTFQKEGIYSIHGSRTLSTIEQLMKAVPLKEYMQEVRKVYNELTKLGKPPPHYTFTNSKLRKYEDLLRLRDLDNEPKMEKSVFVPVIKEKKEFRTTYRIRYSYEKNMLSEGVYQDKPVKEPKKPTIHQKDFILNPKLDLIDKNIPYHIDFWEKQCALDKYDVEEC